MHVEIELAQIFVRALVVGIARQRPLIIVERARIVAQHAMSEAEIVEDVRAVWPLLQRPVEVGHGFRIFLAMDQAHGRSVVVHGHAAAHRRHASAAAGSAHRPTGGGRERTQEKDREQNRSAHCRLHRNIGKNKPEQAPRKDIRRESATQFTVYSTQGELHIDFDGLAG
jgi:hypothetical protein